MKKIISIDGARPESYADVRLGDHLPEILENLDRWQRLARESQSTPPELGISFVVMKRNLPDLAEILELAKKLGARHFSDTRRVICPIYEFTF